MEVIRVENLSKLYDLGQVGTSTISKDLNRWWARVRGKDDPYSKIGHVNDRTKSAVKHESVWALKDIDFSIDQGDVVGIIGRNGAGKSTLLKIISRITTPTKGAVKLKGRIASLLEVGTGFHPEMTGRENIFMNGTLLGMTRSEIQSKLSDIVDFAGVAKYIDTPVKRYSSGMQVRLGFAVAAFLETEILIVDEVLAVGDAEFQAKAIGKMKEVSTSSGKTVLFVSHNMAAVKSLCQNTIVFSKGMVLGRWESERAIKNYLENFTSMSDLISLENLLENDIDPAITYHCIDILQNGAATNEYHTDEPIEFFIQYSIKQPLHGFRLYAEIFDDNGVLIVKSFFDEANDMGTFMEVGIYKSILVIPEDLLVEANYKVVLYTTLHNVRMLHPVNGILFSLKTIETGYFKRKRFNAERGLLTLPFKWNVFKME
jgi:lipopolysaccharide transport system ATP-binding protein